MMLPLSLRPKLVSPAWLRPTLFILSFFSASGLKIPEMESGQVAYGIPVTEKLLGTTPPTVPRHRGHAGQPSLTAQSPVKPSVLCRPPRLCDNSACWASSVHPREEASRPRFRHAEQEPQRAGRLANPPRTCVWGGVSCQPWFPGCFFSMGPSAPSRDSLADVQNGQGETSLVV